MLPFVTFTMKNYDYDDDDYYYYDYYYYYFCKMYVVVNFLIQVIFVCLLCLGMVICADEVETKEK